ncbi:protein adenylyltransferase SelO [Paludisphaera mucosa]|uniref:Protein nucleotidyltransferase YdiU n=1 Tax=Paludisphaera mucosa TaxID=3030827 RepID=A0ABT6FAQ2_9BACT|nr:YdiU family protein [Paludisphaera mucosa]MDG3004672.1 YdiU family protein [Paludisphaera mucosa]
MVTGAVSGADADDFGWRFDNTYARLPDALSVPATPARVREPRASILNHRLAGELGLDLDAAAPEGAAALFAGQELPAGSRPIAQAYAGHQYGHFTMLGDGRAILLGEHRTPAGGLVDVQFKGSGRTRFSRGGDGRAALGPMLREYIVSEAMAALGVPTTRSLAVVATGEPVYRETARRGAILTRVAASHIRVGTFEYAAALGDEPTLRALADYAIDRHDPALAGVPGKYLEFLRAVADRQAALIARWQLVGFIHGVMNTDNMAVSGETIDYGPCAFMNAYDPDTVFSSIDRAGRYAYGRQPDIALWNLARLAETLLPLLDPDEAKAIAAATEVLAGFPAAFEGYWLAGMRRKLGLRTGEPGDADLVAALLAWMHKSRADFVNTFRDLSPERPSEGDPEFLAWHGRWRERLGRDGQPPDAAVALMRASNPAVIPRNHQVEEALAAAEDRDDLSPLHDLLSALASPYEPRGDVSRYQAPPPDECGYRTFCGT